MASPSYSPVFYSYSLLRYIFDTLFSQVMPSLKPRRVDLSGKTAIVTGANVGIGLEIARQLATMGATVILACRNVEKGQKAIEDILESGKGTISSNQLEVMSLNCSDLDSVRAFISAWGSKPLDILVNNAGMTPAQYEKSPQGFEMTYAVNTLSQVLLTLSLLPLMNAGARIVNVSSAANYTPGKQVDVQDLDYSKAIEKKYRLKPGDFFSSTQLLEVYGVSKLLQLYFTIELQRALDSSSLYAEKGITIHAYHPGMVKSNIFTKGGVARVPALKGAASIIGISCEQGAATGVFLATDQQAVDNKGCYWDRMALRSPNGLAYDEKARNLAWQQMVADCKLEGGLKL